MPDPSAKIGNLYYDIEVRDRGAEAKLDKVARAAKRASDDQVRAATKIEAAERKQAKELDNLVRKYEQLHRTQNGLVGQTAQYGHAVTFLNNAAAITGSRFVGLMSKIAGMTGAYQRMAASVRHAKKEMEGLTAQIIAQGGASRIGMVPGATGVGGKALFGAAAGSALRVGPALGLGIAGAAGGLATYFMGMQQSSRGRDRFNDFIDNQISGAGGVASKFISPFLRGAGMMTGSRGPNSLNPFTMGANAIDKMVDAREKEERAAQHAADDAERMANRVQQLSSELKSAKSVTESLTQTMMTNSQQRKKLQSELANVTERGEAGMAARSVIKEKMHALQMQRTAEAFGRIPKSAGAADALHRSFRESRDAATIAADPSMEGLLKIEEDRRRQVQGIRNDIEQRRKDVRKLEATPAADRIGTNIDRQIEKGRHQIEMMRDTIININKLANTRQSMESMQQFQKQMQHQNQTIRMGNQKEAERAKDEAKDKTDMQAKAARASGLLEAGQATFGPMSMGGGGSRFGAAKDPAVTLDKIHQTLLRIAAKRSGMAA